jgi:hypothetical protein
MKKITICVLAIFTVLFAQAQKTYFIYNEDKTIFTNALDFSEIKKATNTLGLLCKSSGGTPDLCKNDIFINEN